MIFKVEPLTKKDVIAEKLALEIKEAKEDIKRGMVYDFKEVAKGLGL